MAVMYRGRDSNGELQGGPMYVITEGLGKNWKPLAIFYALTIALAAFGFACMFQSNQAASALEANFAIPRWAAGIALTVLVGATIIGGISRIGAFAARIVPAPNHVARSVAVESGKPSLRPATMKSSALWTRSRIRKASA